MERRVILAGLLAGAAGATLAAGSATAQSAPPSAPAPAPAMKADVPAAGLSDPVKAHIRDTMAAGVLSLAITRIAQGKLKHPMGKQFADFEAAEQNAIADILKARTLPGVPPLGEVKAPTDAEVEDGLDAQGRETVETFRAMKEGPGFEKAYVAAQVDGHRRLLEIQDAYLKVADDAAETAIAKLARGTIREHLTILGDIARHLG